MGARIRALQTARTSSSRMSGLTSACVMWPMPGRRSTSNARPAVSSPARRSCQNALNCSRVTRPVPAASSRSNNTPEKMDGSSTTCAAQPVSARSSGEHSRGHGAHLANHVGKSCALHAVACGGSKKRVDLVCHRGGVLAAERAVLCATSASDLGRRRVIGRGCVPAGSRTAAPWLGALRRQRLRCSRTAWLHFCCAATWAGSPSLAGDACARCPSAATAAAAVGVHPRRVSRCYVTPRERAARLWRRLWRRRTAAARGALDRAKRRRSAARQQRGAGVTRHSGAGGVERSCGRGRQRRPRGGGPAYGSPRFGVVEQREDLARRGTRHKPQARAAGPRPARRGARGAAHQLLRLRQRQPPQKQLIQLQLRAGKARPRRRRVRPCGERALPGQPRDAGAPARDASPHRCQAGCTAAPAASRPTVCPR